MPCATAALGSVLAAALGSVLAAALLAATPPCALSPSAPVAEGAACGLARPAERAPTAESLAPRGPAVVEVTSRDCPACRRMEPVIAEAERRCGTRVVRAFIEDADGAALQLRHGIAAVPTFLVLGAGGEEVDRLVGVQSVEIVRRALRRVSSTPCR
jgi:cytochrome c-type biogenesis protein